MKKYTVKKDGRYWTRDGANEGFITPGIAGCYSYPLAGALWIKAHKGGEIVEVAKEKGKTVEGEPWDGKVLILEPLCRSNATAIIAEGSGIVGVECDEDHYTVYYEGNIYNTPSLDKPEDRVKHAAGRLLRAYPTVARGTFPKNLFRVMGHYHAASGRIELEGKDMNKYTVVTFCFCGCNEEYVFHVEANTPDEAAGKIHNDPHRATEDHRVIAVFEGHLENLI
jgi:hypothetical protein